MSATDSTAFRSTVCGSLRAGDAGETVRVAGWVHRRRDHGHLIFIDLRDRSGLVQVVFDAEKNPESHALGETVRGEFVLAVAGKVVPRSAENINPNLPTGEIEIRAEEVRLLNRSETLPFPLDAEGSASEELRLRYRFLDLRRPFFQHCLRSLVARLLQLNLTYQPSSYNQMKQVELRFRLLYQNFLAAKL